MKPFILVIVLIILSLILGIIGFNIEPEFLKFSIGFLKDENLIITVRGMSSKFNNSLRFAIVCGTLPFLSWAACIAGKAKSTLQVLIITCSIIIGGLLIWQIRIMQIAAIVTTPVTRYYQHTHISLEELYLSQYLGLGFLCGALISGISIRQINKRKKDWSSFED